MSARAAIRLSPDVSLPLDAVTQTFGILGKRGSGKTNTAGVLTEQLIKQGLPVVYVDPIGVTWGLRHSRDGKGPGLPVVILGGEHADVPLEETGGTVIADFVIENHAPMVLDLGLFSKSAQRRFMVDFSERLYLKNREALHVMLDECDTFVPQRIDHGGERLVGAINDLVRKGRARGLGVTLISQRPALINKDVLTQVETLIAHRMTGPQDRDAIERWVEHNADGGNKDREILASFQSLEDGEAWVWSPSWLGTLVRTRVNLRETFDSSATPKPGERVASPKRAAEVDLAALREQLAATIEKVKADDPRELRRKIAELEKRTTQVVASSILTKDQEQALASLRDEIAGIRAGWLPKVSYELETLMKLLNGCNRDIEAMAGRVDKLLAKFEAIKAVVPAVRSPSLTANGSPARRPMPFGVRKLGTGEGESMPSGHRRILAALAKYGQSSKAKLAILARYAVSGGGFNNYLSALRTAGRIDQDDDSIRITDAGVEALGAGGFDALPAGADGLFEDWMRHPELGKSHREVMRVLREHDRTMTKEEIAAACNPPYEPGGGGFNNTLSRLRTLGIVEGRMDMRLADELR